MTLLLRSARLLSRLATVTVVVATGCSGGGDATTNLSSETVPETASQPSPPSSTATATSSTSEARRSAIQLEELSWTRSNPGGGGAFSTVAVSADGSVILAGSDLSGLARSSDGAESWTVAGARQGLTDTHVSAIQFDRDDPDVVFVGTDGGVYRSDDAGATAELVRGISGYVSALAVDGDTVYVGVQPRHNSNEGNVYVSADGGSTFLEAGSPAPGRYLLALEVDPGDPSRLIALTGDGRFTTSPREGYLSVDGAETWVRLDPGGAVLDFRFDTHNPRTIWATYSLDDESDPVLARFDDGVWTAAAERGGVLWLPADRPGTIRLINTETQYPWDDRNGTWESVDSGSTFDQVGLVENWSTGWSDVYFNYSESFNGSVTTLGFDPSDGDRALWVNSQWIFETLDGGRTFGPIFTDEVGATTWLSRGFDNVVVADVAASADGATLYVGYWDLGCFRSPDAGESWENCNTAEFSGDWEGDGGFTGTVASDPARPEVVWASHAQDFAVPAVLLRSDERGRPGSWRETSGLPAVPNLLGLAVDPASPEQNRTMYITADGDIHRSVDDGWTWSLDFDCGACRSVHVGGDGSVYAGGEAGIWNRIDDSWTNVGGLGGLGGEVTGPPWEFGWGGVAAIATESDGTIWTAVTGTGLLSSDDGGASWEVVVDDPFVRDVTVELGGQGVVWLASSSAVQAGGYDESSMGLTRTVDGGATWETVDLGLSWPFASHVEVVAGAVIAASPGAGIVIGR